jgi:NET1-associated nuclear protein 1 (U3 small nucleolar RNA-associated protein 17)
MISGGSENVLVIWQMDTGKKDFLPHLSGSVENIVVSPNGSSYVLHLDDNSAMIISTAEMKPTAYISGIQSAAANVSIPKDMLVRRAWGTAENVWRQIPAAIRPTEPSQLHVCVGSGQQATMTGALSAPLLQTFDLESFTSINRQPLARTQPTDVNLSAQGLPIEEPLITHMAFSSDGLWLASVDVWNPPEKDIDNVTNGSKDQFLRERQEVYLKFWDVSSGDSSAALVSRINTPHATSQPETVLDLAANPVSACFATIGSDGMVRLWRPRLRQQHGIVAKGSDGRDISTWSCSQVIPVGDGLGQDGAVDLHSMRVSQPQGAVAFSEDGSTIFAAFGAVDTGVVYIIDAASGEIVRTLEDLWTGRLRSIRTLSPFLLILSDQLRVFDVVGDELRYGIEMSNSDEAGGNLLQLAVDYTSRHFAVATPLDHVSSIGIFDPEESEPLLVRSLPHRAVSLVSTPQKSGFLVLDDAAQVWTVTEGSDPSSLASMQPLVDLRLDDQSTANSQAQAVLNGEDADMVSDNEDADEPEKPADEDVEMDDDDDDVHASVVVQQHLAEIFDATPAFASPSVEEMFYKVTALLGAKPLISASE